MTKGNREGGPEQGGIPAGTQEETGQVNGQEQPTAGESKSPEQLRHERLVALLREVAEQRGKVRAAEALGVSFRTLARAVESGRLTGRMADALERHLREVQGPVTPVPTPSEEDGLEQRVGQLEASMAQLQTRIETIGAVVGALQEDQARTLGQWERRLARVESRPVAVNESGVVTSPGVKGASEGAGEKPEVKRPRRPYPQLVTVEPEDGEELIYGEAMPAITEWRETRSALGEARRRRDKLDARKRMVELEVKLVGDHELTLPPAVYPWDRAARRDEVWRRKQSLGDLRVERSRAMFWRWVRRVLTLGLWRK
ncbi:MAG: hypothetical protein OXG61_05080 [Chloroflexi bacterium]|nr:hypothetical protein [Chloroflexota bacterium]